MRFVPQTLDRVRVALLGRRTPGKHTAAYTAPAAPPTPRRRPTPDVWGARLVITRRHRRERHTPPVQPLAEWERTGAMVRPYVAHLGPLGEAPTPWRRVQ